jgi:hypothetical protein
VVKPPAKKPKKKGDWKKSVPMNPEGFANMSVGIEKLTLNVHKDKVLKAEEEQFIRSSATQMAELYEIPKLLVVIQYGASMVMPHIARYMTAQSEKVEIENESKKIDLEEKKRKLEEGRQKIASGDVFKSVVKDGNKSN